jgi:hypothetical protein
VRAVLVLQYSKQAARAVSEYNLGYWVLEATDVACAKPGLISYRVPLVRVQHIAVGGEAFETPKKTADR